MGLLKRKITPYDTSPFHSARRPGYDVVGVFKETASGASANRAARNRILDLAQVRQIDAILVTQVRQQIV